MKQLNDTQKYLHLWNGDQQRYRLEKVSYQPGALQLPTKPTFLSREDIEEPMLIMSERGSGFKIFHDWLDSKNEHWDFYGIDTLPKDLKINLADSSCKGIFIDRTITNAKTETDEMLTRIVSFLDNNLGIKKLICISFYRDEFRNDPIFSNLMDHSHVYKLPSFDYEDLNQWILWFLNKITASKKPSDKSKESKHTSPNSLITTIINELGGQPKLTDLLFSLVNQDNPNAKNLEDLIKKHIRIIKKSPPNFVTKLKSELKEMIRSNPERKLLLSRYVSGSYKPDKHDFHPEDINLYLAGWLGQTQNGWGIRSECHLAWAKEVLRGVQ